MRGRRYKNNPSKLKKDIVKVIGILEKEVEDYDVPVITMIAENRGNPFKILISTVLSLRTRDETTLKATERLFLLAKTPKSMKELGEEKIKRAIYPVGFYNTKAKNIIKICDILIREHKGRVPDTMGDLLKLPNVGRKTANLVLTHGYKKVEGIAVDTHCHRFPNRTGFLETKTPEETEKELMEYIPKKLWQIFNDIVVAFGQGRCKPISPRCDGCPVLPYCDYGKNRPKTEKKSSGENSKSEHIK